VIDQVERCVTGTRQKRYSKLGDDLKTKMSGCIIKTDNFHRDYDTRMRKKIAKDKNENEKLSIFLIYGMLWKEKKGETW